jgi:demethylsterigmatocystin 6-O-methyltransferase
MEAEMASWSAEPDKAIFVDIGAGLGQACIQFKEKYPNLPGRIVLQELPPFIQTMNPIDRVELMAHNFLTPQPVQGASIHALFHNIILFSIRIPQGLPLR